MLADLRFAWRGLVKSPGFSIAAIVALALGVGANTAIFSVVNQTLLNPAGVVHPERVVALRVRYGKLGLKNINVSVPDYADARESKQIFASTAILDVTNLNYSGAGAPQQLRGAAASYRWFEVFGARPYLGRTFTAAEDQPDANRIAVLSYGAWQRLFGGDAGVVGRNMELNQQSYRVIGVMGPEFRWPLKVDVWTPIGLPAEKFTEDNRFNESFTAVGLLKPGVSLEQTKAWMQVLTGRERSNGRQQGAYAKAADWSMFVEPFTDLVAGNTKTPLLVLMGAVGFVLLIACANIAGLMLARGSRQAREIAVRAALGASRWRLIRQTLFESALLGAGGAAVGLGVAYEGMRGLILLAPSGNSIPLSAHLDSTMLAFTALAGIAAALLFGAAPAWQISRLGGYDSLKDGGRSSTAGRTRQRTRSALVIGEVALALTLLAGTGLFLRGLVNLQDVNPGFQPTGVMTALVNFAPGRFKTAAEQAPFVRGVLERLSAAPGVTQAAACIPMPFSGDTWGASFSIEGKPVSPGDPGPHGDVAIVSPQYFAALEIPLRSGRVFTDADTADTEPVAVIDETLAQRYWPGENPVGAHLRNGGNSTPWARVIGVVGHVAHSDLGESGEEGKYYFPMGQQQVPYIRLVARTASAPALLSASIHDAVESVDPAQPVANLTSMPDLVEASLAPRRFVVTLLGVFAAAALAMAALGLYGVISYSVAQRTQEIGIRMALGAQQREVLAMVLGQGARMAGAGFVIGLGASIALSRALRSQLFHVNPFDPFTFAAAAAVLAAAVLLACYFPARRATRVDPMQALRNE
jgi:predicted permease